MKDIIIIGAGGFGREVKTLIDQINIDKNKFNILGFYDDNDKTPEMINGVPYLGNIDQLIRNKSKINIALGIGDPEIKSEVIKRLDGFGFIYPQLIHPSAIIGDDEVSIGPGTIICAGTVITCNVVIESFVTLNLCNTVGHDSKLGRFSSFMPSVNISGEVSVGEKVYVGTGVKIINQIELGESSIIGAGAVVSKNIPPNCTAVGIPAKPIKFHEKNE